MRTCSLIRTEAAAVCLLGALLAGAARGAPLDADGNGLYDDAERKALLDALQEACPEVRAVYDADGDGKVSVQEQSAGRHPLSQLIPQSAAERLSAIPWGLDIFPEWLMTAYLQEDVAPGVVGAHPARGVIAATAAQTNAAARPCKPEPRGGIAFAADAGQSLSMPWQRDARWNYRWCLLAFRIDGASGDASATTLLDLNRGNGPNLSSPKIWYDKEKGLSVQYVGRNAWGHDRRVMTSKAVAADGKTWNVVVCGIRYGQLFVSLNGTPLATDAPQPDRFSGEMPSATVSEIGDARAGAAAWAYDALVFGQSELSEAMVRKLTGWAAHRLGFQALLPEGHPYRAARPVLDGEDLPHRYVHDDERWTRWGAAIKDKGVTRVNAGGARVEPQGFERVFFDDFRAMRIRASTSGEGDLWVGPGFNTAVGMSAQLLTPGRKPDVYAHDAEKGHQLLSLAKQGDRWYASAFYSVNDMGHGYSWNGPKVFRIRCLFPKSKQKELIEGLFPAFWSYGTEWLFWRTSNRIEADWFEFDGKNGRWYNGLSSHYHYCAVKNTFAKNPDRYKSHKAYSGELTEEKGKIPGGLFFWDGRFHSWEFVIGAETTFVNVTIPDQDGNDRWVEVCRCPTAPTYLERLDLQLDYALKESHKPLPTDARQDFVVDWVEVLQRTSDVESVPEPFTGKPVLTGDSRVGGTVTCAPNVKGVTDIRYYWFADGYPLTYGAQARYTLTAAEAGKTLRCLVKAVGARDMPEAWSAPFAVARER